MTEPHAQSELGANSSQRTIPIVYPSITVLPALDAQLLDGLEVFVVQSAKLRRSWKTHTDNGIALRGRFGWRAHSTGNPDEQAHDTYFRVERFCGSPREIVALTIASARTKLREDLDARSSNLDLEALNQMDDALALAQDRIGILLPLPELPVAANGNGPCLGRWIRGHQVFAALTQSLVCALDCLAEAIASDDAEEVMQEGRFVAEFLRASGVALRLAADVSADEYNDVIRPSMAPPHALTSLSGLMSSDHRVLVTRMSKMRDGFARIAELAPEANAIIRQELAKIYDLHGLVCENFVGRAPSLRGRMGKKAPALEVLDRFKQRRLGVFPPA